MQTVKLEILPRLEQSCFGFFLFVQLPRLHLIEHFHVYAHEDLLGNRPGN